MKKTVSWNVTLMLMVVLWKLALVLRRIELTEYGKVTELMLMMLKAVLRL